MILEWSLFHEYSKGKDLINIFSDNLRSSVFWEKKTFLYFITELCIIFSFFFGDLRCFVVNHLKNVHNRYVIDYVFQYLQVTEAYEDYNYSRVMNIVDKFNSNWVSAFHAHITKDR